MPSQLLDLLRLAHHYGVVRIPRHHLLHVGLVVGLGFLAATPVVLLTLPRARYRPHALRENLSALLWHRHGILVRTSDMIIPASGEQHRGLTPRELYFIGRRRGQKHKDAFFAHFILSGQAVPVHASPAFSLSRTHAANETGMIYDGRRYLAYATQQPGTRRTSMVTVLDLAGMSTAAMADFTSTQRLQQKLTNWQDTGRWRGLDRLEVRLALARRVTLGFDAAGLKIHDRKGRWQVVVDPARGKVVSGPARAQRVRVGSRSFIHWAVDSVRNFSFVGPQRIAWLEDLVYGVVDKARRMSGAEVTGQEIQDEMDLPVVGGPAGDKIKGWPPPPLTPFVRPSLKGEGRWVPVKGPFVKAQAGLPSMFAMTFLRPDKERLFSRVYFVAWDPRRVELNMVGGTREPRSATGHRGSGMIPRQPAVVRRLVGAFNGGFQSIHGDFGMMVDRKVVIPAKPWAATVARLADGSTGFGTWDGKARHGWTPRWIQSFRQNLTPLVEDGKFNPWKRGSWGGGTGFVTGQGPKAHIIRSGLCLHNSGHVMYVQGDPVDGPILGRTMQKAGCSYGMELDINRGHVGLEFYNVLSPGDKAPPGADRFRNIKYFSHTDTYPGLPGHTFYTREVVRGTGNRCPRWVGREARDFFYLLRRRLLPGADLKYISGKPNEGRWTVATLPRAAVRFPQAMARTFLHPGKDLQRVHLLALDLRWLDTTLCIPQGDDDECLPAPGKGTDGVLAVLPLGSFGNGRGLLVDGRAAAGDAGGLPHLVLSPGRPGGTLLPRLAAKASPGKGSVSVESAGGDQDVSARVRGALCVSDAVPQQLLYATGLGASARTLAQVLAHAGCKKTVQLGRVEPMVLMAGGAAGMQSVYGQALPPSANEPSLVFRRSAARWGTRIFTHVKVQPRKVWTKLQPEATRSTKLRHANKAIALLGLEPIRTLKQLCKAPYADVPELRKYRWKDPITGATTCPGDLRRGKGKGKGKGGRTPFKR